MRRVRPSSGCVIRNNLTSSLNVSDGVTVDHNLVIKDPTALFVDVSANDLRLRPDAEAIDAGSPEMSPMRDAAGTTRPQGKGIDIGAYEFTQSAGP